MEGPLLLRDGRERGDVVRDPRQEAVGADDDDEAGEPEGVRLVRRRGVVEAEERKQLL